MLSPDFPLVPSDIDIRGFKETYYAFPNAVKIVDAQINVAKNNDISDTST